MSTVANTGTTKASSKVAPAFIVLIAFTASLLLAHTLTGTHQRHGWEFVGLLFAGAVSSRFKIKLPGINGNMSVNLPFIFVAMTQLSAPEAMTVAGISVLVQSIPKAPHTFVPVQAVFNISTSLVAAALGSDVFHFGLRAGWNSAVSLILACTVHFFFSTAPVAGIISLTDGRRVFATWSDIVQMSFPYYLASTGLASIADGLGGHANLMMLLGMICVMFVTYRSYRMYFNAMRAQQALSPSSTEDGLVKSTAAGR